MAKPKFSKAALDAYIQRRRAELREEFGFDPDNGTSQCDGQSDDFKIAYGHYEALADLRDVFEI